LSATRRVRSFAADSISVLTAFIGDQAGVFVSKGGADSNFIAVMPSRPASLRRYSARSAALKRRFASLSDLLGTLSMPASPKLAVIFMRASSLPDGVRQIASRRLRQGGKARAVAFSGRTIENSS